MKNTVIATFVILLMSFSANAQAQESIIEDINYTQLENFIALAKEHYPRRKITELNEKKAKSLVPLASLELLDMFNLSYYYRPENKNTINPDNPYVFNGIQYGIGVNLGSLISKPFRIKDAKIDQEIARQERMDYDKILELDVKSKYYAYILQLKELKLRSQAVQDARTYADDVSLRFERGEVDFEAYNSSKSTLTSAAAGQVQAEVSYLMAKDQLESLIGKKLTELEIK